MPEKERCMWGKKTENGRIWCQTYSATYKDDIYCPFHDCEVTQTTCFRYSPIIEEVHEEPLLRRED